MPTIDSTTNVYEISRSTVPTLIDITTYIDNSVGDSIGDIITVNPLTGLTEQDLLDLFNSWIVGFNFQVTDNSTEYNSWYELELGIKAELNGNIAAAGLLMEAYVDDHVSVATLDLAVATAHDNAIATVDARIGAYSSAVEAIAWGQDTLTATYDDISASITEGAAVWAGEISVNNITEYLTVAAMLADTTQIIGTIAKIPQGTTPETYEYYQWTGEGIIGENGTGWIKTTGLDALKGVSTLGTAKSLYIDPSGNALGWQYAGGTGFESTFKIVADNFEIASGQVDVDGVPINPIPIFDVDTGTGTVTFSGVVPKENVEDLPTYFGELSTEPAGTVSGDTYFNTADLTLYTFNGSSWTSNSRKPVYAWKGIDSTWTLDTYYATANLTTDFQSSAGVSDLIVGDTLTVRNEDTVGGNFWTGVFKYLGGGVWEKDRLLVGPDMVTTDLAEQKAQAREDLATNMGYASWADMYAKAISGQTIILGGYIRTSLIEADAITAIHIDATTMTLDKLNLGGYHLGQYSGIAVGYSASNYYGIAAIGTGTGVQGNGNNFGVWGYTAGAANSVGVGGNGDIGIRGSGTSYGLYTNDPCYFEGAAYPFTGAHLCLSTSTPEVGDILVSTDAYIVEVSKTLVVGDVSTSSSNKSSYGVYNGHNKTVESMATMSDTFSEDVIGIRVIKEEYKALVEEFHTIGYKLLGVNAIGEGAMNVCGENGDIEAGDYICVSNMAGKGMKQSDDIMRSITVAKATQDYVFTSPNEVAMIACTYHCG